MRIRVLKKELLKISHLRLRLRFFFISEKSYVPFTRYSSFSIFNRPMSNHICDVMMSISTWDRVHFGIYLLNHNSLDQQIRSIDRNRQEQ